MEMHMSNYHGMDEKWLMELSKEKILDLLFMHIRNLWTVDGLYFIGIEDKFGTEEATEIDKNVWKVMAKIEARRIKQNLGIENNDIPSFIEALKATSWSLDLEKKVIDVETDRAIFRNLECRIQKARIAKNLGEFPCKNVRWTYLKAFATEINPNIQVNCIICPPDEHPENLWCEWEFIFRI